MTRSYVFLIGAPRSGTTWLQLMLAQSPQVATCNETHLFSSYMRSMFGSWCSFQNRSRAVGLHELLSESEFNDLCRTISARVFERIAARKPSARIILEKTPAHVRSWEAIRRLYPEAQFIHLVRDPRAVVSSLKAASKSWGADWAAGGAVSAAYRWAHDLAISERITPPMMTIRYEDLKGDAPTELQRIFDFMGEKISADECETYARNCVVGQVPQWQPWDMKIEPAGFVRRGYNDWSDLTRSEVSAVEQIAGPFMDKFGYSRSEPSWRGWLRVKGYDAVDTWSRYLSWRATRL